MSINEEITALLNGDLQDETRVAELMHVLAVSPERRGMLLQQIRMSRAFSAMSGDITPPRLADAGILAGIGAIDREFAGGSSPSVNPPPAPELTPLPRATAGLPAQWLRNIIFGVALIALGMGAGYILWHTAETATTTTKERPAAGTSGGRLAATGTEDSLAAARAQLALLSQQYQSALRQIAEFRDLQRASTSTRRESPSSRRSDARAIDEMNRPLRQEQTTPATPKQESSARPTVTPVAPQELRMPPLSAPTTVPQPNHAATSVYSGASLLSQYATKDGGTGPWQVGLRDHFRLSLPRVYGLNGNRSILFDRDLFVSYRFSGEDSPFSSMELGASIGETQFSQVYHSGQPGRAVDLQIEQSPTVRYARAMLGSDIFHTAVISGGLEFGVGAVVTDGDLLGPLGTFGLNLEYRPVDMIALHAGLSSWFLWTEQSSQIYTSTNMNAHIGFAVGF